MDIAEFGLKFNSSGLLDANRKLDKLEKTGNKTNTAFIKLSDHVEKTTSVFNREKQALQQSIIGKEKGAKAAYEYGLKVQGLTKSQRDLLIEMKKQSGAFDDVNGSAGIFGTTLSKISGLLGGIGLASIAKGAFDTYRSFESMNASLKTVTGSAEAANIAFDKIKEFAKTTPYILDQSVQGFQKLKALGLDPSMEALKSYGNTASAMGKDLMQMIEAVADASSGEFERLKEFGIKAKSEGDNVSFTFQGVTTTVKKNSEEIQEYLLAIGNTQFATAMSDQMETINGKIANLSDSFSALQIKLMESGGADLAAKSISTLSGLIVSITENTKEWTVAITTVSAILMRKQLIAIGANITQIGILTATTVTSTLASIKQARALTIATGAMRVSTLAATGLTGVMALLGGPVGLFALAAGAAYLYRDELGQVLEGTYSANEAEKKRNETLKKVKSLSDEAATGSDELAAKNKKLAESELLVANASLARAQAKLAAAKKELDAGEKIFQANQDDPFNFVNSTDATSLKKFRAAKKNLKEKKDS